MDNINDLHDRFTEAINNLELDNVTSLEETYYEVDFVADRLRTILRDHIEEHRRIVRELHVRAGVPTAGPSPGRYVPVPMPPGLYSPRRVSPTYNANVTTIIPTPAAVQPGRVVFPTIPRLNSPTRMGIVVDPVQPLVRQPTVPQPLSPTVTNVNVPAIPGIPTVPRVPVPAIPTFPRVPVPQVPTVRIPHVPRR